MFLGQYAHTLDGKGRLILPARFRWSFTQAYVSCQTEGCLALWSPTAFEERAAEMKALMGNSATPEERNMARVFFAGAQEANPDGQGRITIPLNLREFAGVVPGAGVMVNGAGDYVEIWDAKVWARIQGLGEASMQSGSGQSGSGQPATGGMELVGAQS